MLQFYFCFHYFANRAVQRAGAVNGTALTIRLSIYDSHLTS